MPFVCFKTLVDCTIESPFSTPNVCLESRNETIAVVDLVEPIAHCYPTKYYQTKAIFKIFPVVTWVNRKEPKIVNRKHNGSGIINCLVIKSLLRIIQIFLSQTRCESQLSH